MYPFPTSSPSPASPVTPTSPRCRVRSRALSLLSVKSGASEGLNLEPPKAEPTIFASNSFKNHLACGSFVPNTPATLVLRTFLPTTITHARGRSIHVFPHYEKEPESPISPTSPIPFITRTLPLSSGSSRPPSPVRGYSTLPKPRRASRTHSRSQTQLPEFNSVLTSLEQRSKFYVRKNACSTCKRTGSGFPQCGKCGDSWCSRDCRLKGGRRHVCRTPTI